MVETYPPERAEEISGVKAEDIRKMAEPYATSWAYMILYAMGITQHVSGTDNMNSLAILCGMMGARCRTSS